MDENKKILMICHYYPPLADVGSKRSVAFSKYFRKYGWTPYVLSIKNPDKNFCIIGNESPAPETHCEYTYSIFNSFTLFGKINGLLTRMSRWVGIEIKRNYFYDFFCIPDLFLGWLPFTAFHAYKMIRKYNIDLIYSSCPPFSSALIGLILKGITKKPLIIDFREAYALRFKSLSWLYKKPYIRKIIDRKIEEMLLKNCNLFVIVTEDLRKLYIKQYPQYKEKMFTVYNGFDNNTSPGLKKELKYEKFTIFYAGRFFYETDPIPFFKALSSLKIQKKINSNHFQFLYYGKEWRLIQFISKKYHIDDIVISQPQTTYSKVLESMSKSHIGLLRNMQWAIPVKLFDGILLDLPFLATIPVGEAEDMLKKYSPNSYIVREESVDEISRAILDAMSAHINGRKTSRDITEFMKKYSMENLTVQLMKIIKIKILTTDGKI
ncbi:MAG: hypothetical protein EHM45_07190 [Desulfobacteraceae bacterium]|nr:MAG: hypothetical protein EHM45_07190 [Desulfobacteraceae bacterium]